MIDRRWLTQFLDCPSCNHKNTWLKSVRLSLVTSLSRSFELDYGWLWIIINYHVLKWHVSIGALRGSASLDLSTALTLVKAAKKLSGSRPCCNTFCQGWPGPPSWDVHCCSIHSARSTHIIYISEHSTNILPKIVRQRVGHFRMNQSLVWFVHRPGDSSHSL